MIFKVFLVICVLAGVGNAHINLTNYTPQFQLFTRTNPTNFQSVTIQNSTLSNFNASLETVFVIHGWSMVPTDNTLLSIKTAILGKYDMNVFAVNWSTVAAQIYPFAKESVSGIADDIKDMILHLNQTRSQPIEMMHAVGFSLGAHVAGITGKKVGGLMANVIGLDPALPLFNYWDLNQRINVGDAQYVQVVHTSGDTAGFIAPLGDYDVYPNGGRRQPDCPLFDLACFHEKAMVYFADAVNDSASHYAYKCGSFWEIAFGYCNKIGANIPLVQFKPTTNYYGIYWGKV